MWTGVRSPYSDDPALSIAGELVTTVGRGLRAAGVPVSTGDMLDAVRAINAVDVAHHDEVVEALRASMIKTEGFDDAFDRVVRRVLVRQRPAVDSSVAGASVAGASAAGGSPGNAQAGEHSQHNAAPDDGLAAALRSALAQGDDAEIERLLALSVEKFGGLDAAGTSTTTHHTHRVLRGLGLSRLLQELLREAGNPDDALGRRSAVDDANERVRQLRQRIEELVAGGLQDRLIGPPVDAAPQPALEDLPLLRARADELLALRAAVKPLARRLATRLGRRRRRGGDTVEMRRTIRNSLGSGGVPLVPAMRRRRRSRPDLVVLCDVSGSTAQFAPFTLALLHAVHREFRRVRSFVFVDGIAEITNLVESATGVVDPRHLLAHRGLIAGDGRSDYTRALRRFLDGWPDAVTPKTTVLIVGDARSHDRPPAAAEVSQLREMSRRIYWLNPEPREEWNTGDSKLDDYRSDCAGVYEVSTLRQLGECVAAIG
jgi:uncharacterized protein with von Willebrand factor type A (vWA) domain